MRRSHGLRWIAGFEFLVAFSIVVASCAVPSAPTGGPADSTPPTIEDVIPSDGTTSVTSDQIRISFSEYVNEGSFARAFSIAPELGAPVDFSWRRKTVTIRFNSDLRTNTTYRVTIDRVMRDMNGVSLTEPLVFAFSTGPQINSARIRGRIVHGVTGQPVGNMDLLAYASEDLPSQVEDSLLTLVDALPARPLYRTQTNDDGRFELTYLAAGRYYLIGVADQNNNRLADEHELVAVPPSISSLASESDPDSVDLVAFRFDNLAPTSRRIRAVSDSRIELTLTEPVVLPPQDTERRPTGWSLSDSVGTIQFTLKHVFVSANDPDVIVIVRDTTESWRSTNPLRLAIPSLRDSSGNTSQPQQLYFAPSVRADTTNTRLVAWIPEPAGSDTVATLTPDEWPTVSLNEARDVADWLSVEDAATGAELAFAWSTTDGRSYRIVPDLSTVQGIFSLSTSRIGGDAIPAADSISTRYFRKLRPGEVGEISAVAVASSQPIVELYARREPTNLLRASPADGNRFLRAGLRPGLYGLRAFVDEDGSGYWTPGSIWPHSPGEPIRWVPDSITVRARFETVLPDTLVIEGN